MNNIAGVKVTKSVIFTGVIWGAALVVAFLAVAIGSLVVKADHRDGPQMAGQFYLIFVGTILVLAGLLVTLLEIILGSPLHRVMRAVIMLVAGLNLLLSDGVAVLGLVAAVGVEAYLLRHGIAKPAESDEPGIGAKPAAPAAAGIAAPPPPPTQQA